MHFEIGVAQVAYIAMVMDGRGWYHFFTPCAYKDRKPLGMGEVFDAKCQMSGRYLIIQKWEKGYFGFCEVEVYTSKCCSLKWKCIQVSAAVLSGSVYK